MQRNIEYFSYIYTSSIMLNRGYGATTSSDKHAYAAKYKYVRLHKQKAVTFRREKLSLLISLDLTG